MVVAWHDDDDDDDFKAAIQHFSHYTAGITPKGKKKMEHKKEECKMKKTEKMKKKNIIDQEKEK